MSNNECQIEKQPNEHQGRSGTAILTWGDNERDLGSVEVAIDVSHSLGITYGRISADFRCVYLRFQISIMCCSSLWYCSFVVRWQTCLRVIFLFVIRLLPFRPLLIFSACTHCSSLVHFSSILFSLFLLLRFDVFARSQRSVSMCPINWTPAQNDSIFFLATVQYFLLLYLYIYTYTYVCSSFLSLNVRINTERSLLVELRVIDRLSIRDRFYFARWFKRAKSNDRKKSEAFISRVTTWVYLISKWPTVFPLLLTKRAHSQAVRVLSFSRLNHISVTHFSEHVRGTYL